jgi:hypothetical protein
MHLLTVFLLSLAGGLVSGFVLALIERHAIKRMEVRCTVSVPPMPATAPPPAPAKR